MCTEGEYGETSGPQTWGNCSNANYFLKSHLPTFGSGHKIPSMVNFGEANSWLAHHGLPLVGETGTGPAAGCLGTTYPEPDMKLQALEGVRTVAALSEGAEPALAACELLGCEGGCSVTRP